MNNTKVFQNTWPLQQLPATLKLSNLEWRFLICSDGKMPVDYIQRRLRLSEQECDYVLARLCGSNLLSEVFLSLEEYAKLTVDLAAPVSEPQTLPEYLKAAETALPAQEKSLPAFSPLPKPSPTVATVRAMSLRSVIQFILNQNPDPTAGHLATYQVFMGINTQLLKRNGITSLRFQDDRFITDPELQAAISENIEKVLGKPCPEDVFSNQPASSGK